MNEQQSDPDMSLAPIRYAVLLLIVLLVIGTITIVPGVLRVTGHEFDLVHTLDIAYRYALGDVPHVDVMTPLGVLAILPISLLLEQGYGPGMAYLFAQILVTSALLPGIWWVGQSRLDVKWQRNAYGISMVLLGLSMIFGNDNPSITAAMYYNRWAWILASFAILIVMIPARKGWRSPFIDGLVLGLAGGALILIKATFVVALLPAVLLFFIVDRAWTTLVFAILGALVILAAPTVIWGVGFWEAYLGDLAAVAQSQRTHPGESFGDIAASPANLSKTLLLLGVIMFWRKCGLMTEGLKLLVLAPGLVYITYQNWGNDPKWLFFVALLLLAIPPRESDKPFFCIPAHAFSGVLAAMCIILFLPSMITISTSSFRHLALERDAYTPLFEDLSKADIEIQTLKSYTAGANIPVENIPFPIGFEPEEDELEPTHVTINGERLIDCSLKNGYSGWTQKMIAQLGAVESAVGRRILVTDIYDHLWLYGPFERNIGAAPWFYGTDDGFEGAEFVMVPLCPMATDARRTKLEMIEEKGWVLEEEIRSDLFILYRRAG